MSRAQMSDQPGYKSHIIHSRLSLIEEFMSTPELNQSIIAVRNILLPKSGP